MAACVLVHSFSVSHVEITSGRSSCWKVFTSFFTYTSSCFRLSFGLLGLFVRTFSPLRHLGSSELPDHFRGQELCPDAAATGKVGPPATWHPEMLSSRLGGNLEPLPLFSPQEHMLFGTTLKQSSSCQASNSCQPISGV